MNSFKSLFLAAVAMSTASLVLADGALAHSNSNVSMERKVQKPANTLDASLTTPTAVAPSLPSLPGTIPGAFTSLGGAPMMLPHPGMRP